MSSSYDQALVRAGLITVSPYAAGFPVWRERGLHLARLLVELLATELARAGQPPLVTEHPFLLPADGYQRAFGHYLNTYRTGLPAVRQQLVLRPDQLAANVELLRRHRHRGPVAAVGGLLRTLRRGAAPLFRDRYMWPAVQINQLVPPTASTILLDTHQRVLDRVFRALSLPVVHIRADGFHNYGKRCYLAVSCLPDGRPSVLATSYVMADRYRTALDSADDIIDVGFTGKAVALVASHHWDGHGVQLPSTITPTQVGIVAPGEPPRPLLNQLGAGVRTEVLQAHSIGRRYRAEQRLWRQGVPLVVGLQDDGSARLARRAPLEREVCGGLPDAAGIRGELTRYDQRLLRRAQRRFDHGLRESGTVRGVCQRCAARSPVLGWTVPSRSSACASCGRPGAEALVSEQGRLY